MRPTEEEKAARSAVQGGQNLDANREWKKHCRRSPDGAAGPPGTLGMACQGWWPHPRRVRALWWPYQVETRPVGVEIAARNARAWHTTVQPANLAEQESSRK